MDPYIYACDVPGTTQHPQHSACAGIGCAIAAAATAAAATMAVIGFRIVSASLRCNISLDHTDSASFISSRTDAPVVCARLRRRRPWEAKLRVNLCGKDSPLSLSFRHNPSRSRPAGLLKFPVGG